MRIWFRDGLYAGAGIAFLMGIFLIWLWGADHQVRRHTDNLLHAIETRNWTGLASFIATDYEDQWGNDGALLLERTRLVFQYAGRVRITPGYVIVQIDRERGSWQAKITIECDNGEMNDLLKERVNTLATSFQLDWRRASAKPWDWKLVKVSNPGLEIPTEWR